MNWLTLYFQSRPDSLRASASVLIANHKFGAAAATGLAVAVALFCCSAHADDWDSTFWLRAEMQQQEQQREYEQEMERIDAVSRNMDKVVQCMHLIDNYLVSLPKKKRDKISDAKVEAMTDACCLKYGCVVPGH